MRRTLTVEAKDVQVGWVLDCRRPDSWTVSDVRWSERDGLTITTEAGVFGFPTGEGVLTLTVAA